MFKHLDLQMFGPKLNKLAGTGRGREIQKSGWKIKLFKGQSPVTIIFVFIFISALNTSLHTLKGLAQAKVIKKSVILFWLLKMTIWCKHVHRLELQMFLIFYAAHLPVRLHIETKFPYFQFLKSGILSLYLAYLPICSSSLWTCLHHMVILRSQNKITDFFMILA